jgi:nucleotide-binding universal stress UspA family protein
MAVKVVTSILVPTDFSELSQVSLEYVSSLAVLYDAKVYLMYVVDNASFRAFPAIGQNAETFLRDLEKKAMEQLRTMVNDKFSQLKRVLPVVLRGEPSREIVRFAREESVDLIVIATHGRTGISHVLMGSVAEKVVRHSPVPVLTVKPASMRGIWMEQSDLDEQLHLKP